MDRFAGRVTVVRSVRRALGLAATTALLLGAGSVLPLAAPAAADWPMYGHDLANSRSAGTDGPSPAQAAALKQAWSFSSTHGDFTGTPVVADGTLVAGTNLGTIYALDPVTGKLRWSRNVGQQINGSAAIDPAAPGGATVFVPIARVGSPHLLALSLSNGAVRWDSVLTKQPTSDVFGSPGFSDGTLYIGTSGPNNDEATARGSVVALDEASGAIRWRTYTVPPGHDGGAVWSTPAIDGHTGRLYVGTGNAYHSPAADTTDSMMVLDATTGQILGHFQATAGDVWELDNPSGGPDYDFGASPNLINGPGGRPLVGEGQKSGTYWALDRATMKPVWRTMVGPGSQADGGVNSSGYDGTRIYGTDGTDSQVFALGRDGSAVWSSFDTGVAHLSPVAVGNGVVYSVDPDGFLNARDAATGAILTKVPLDTPLTFGGISIVGRAVYVDTGTGPPLEPVPGVDTSQSDGNGTIIAFGDTSASGRTRSGPQSTANTFSGNCQMTGSVSFQPALTNSPQSVRQSARATGECSGTFTDRTGRTHQLSNAPATYQASEQASGATCGGGTDSGTGVLGFPYGTVGFSISEVRAGPLVTARAQGASGGSAAGQGNVSPSESPVTVLQACGGSGLLQVPIDIRLSTTPSISG